MLDVKALLDKAGVVEQKNALRAAAGQAFYNTSKFTLRDLRARASRQRLEADFRAWLDGFSPNVQDILESFEFRNQIPRLSKADALGALIEKLTSPDVNLGPAPVKNDDGSVRHPGLDNHGMGSIFEELVRRFNEENNEEAGEHWTPRDAVRLMAKLVFLPVADDIRSGTYLLYDGACGTGGMLTVAEETLRQLAAEHGKDVSTHLFGQEINAETYAICKADLLLKGEGEAADNIVGGPEHSTLANDAFPSREFDFMLSNPPYGKSWKTDLERMGGKKGMRDPRFAIEHDGDPEYSLVTRSSDGQMLFLANKLSKMKRDTPLGSRIAEVHNGSSLFTGDAGQGESNIRRWIIENDWLEAIVALPLNMFYNTGIATYVWVLTNRKPEHRRGRVQLIDATKWYRPLRKNLGKKNCELGDEDIARICETFLSFEETEQSRILDNAAFGYWKVTVERPLRIAGADPNRVYRAAEIKELKENGKRSEDAPPIIRKIHQRGTEADPLRGRFAATVDGRAAVVEHEPDAELRDTEQIPLQEERGIEAFLRREVLPYAAAAWYRPDGVKIGYDQLHALLLQAEADARAGGDPGRHPGPGERKRGAARRPSGSGTTGGVRETPRLRRHLRDRRLRGRRVSGTFAPAVRRFSRGPRGSGGLGADTARAGACAASGAGRSARHFGRRHRDTPNLGRSERAGRCVSGGGSTQPPAPLRCTPHRLGDAGRRGCSGELELQAHGELAADFGVQRSEPSPGLPGSRHQDAGGTDR